MHIFSSLFLIYEEFSEINSIVLISNVKGASTPHQTVPGLLQAKPRAVK